MERCREGRRGGLGGGPLSAPRRPRSSGFKDAPVGEDGDDVMDDVHNPRLRERPKKDSTTGFTAGQGSSGSGGSTSRNKRKRQGLQELQGHTRSTTVDEVDETIEDTEIGASEDDDDPPPPPIPRRPGKFRPKGKFLEDGIPTDLPTVPRKARTAILKRPQESPCPPIAEASHQGFTAIVRNPAPKSSGSNLRAANAPKAFSSAIISDQEVEVAEALFDLARMFTNQSTSSKREVSAVMNPEPKVENKAEPEEKLEEKTTANNVTHSLSPPCPPGRSVQTSTAVSLPLASLQTSRFVTTVPVDVSPHGVISSVADDTVGTLLIPAIMVPPLIPVTAPPAEAPKRKRLRPRTRLDLVELPESRIDVSNLLGFSAPLLRLESEQILSSNPSNMDNGSIKAESGRLVSAASTTMPVSATLFSRLRLAPDNMDFNCPAAVRKYHSPDKKSVAAEMEMMKVEVSCSSSSSSMKFTTQLNRKLAPALFPPPQASLTWETDLAFPRLSGTEPRPKLDLGIRHAQQPSSTTVEGRLNKFDFDLMVPPTMKSVPSPALEKTRNISGNKAKDSLEIDPVSTITAGEHLCSGREIGQDNERHQELEMHHEDNRECDNKQEREKDMETELERQRGPETCRDGECQQDLSKERDREIVVVKEELLKQFPQERQGEAPKLESSAHNIEIVASGNALSAVSSFLVASTVATSVSRCPANSGGIPSWPVCLPPMGYYTSAAAGAVWPCAASLSGGGVASADETTPEGVQLQPPYLIQAPPPQPWKRSASHVYIAHFIDVQQQMNRHPFIQAAYQTSASLFGVKPYNLNVPLPPPEGLFRSGPGGPIIGALSGTAGVGVFAGGGSGSGLTVLSGSDRSLGVTTLMASSQSKDKVYGETSCRKQPVQQQQHPPQSSPNLSLQSGHGFGFTVTQGGSTAVASPAENGGPGGNSGFGGGSALVCINSTTTTGSNMVAGAGAGNGGVASHAIAQAQYLQAVMQQGGFPFPFQAAHFGPSFNDSPGHIGPQHAAQLFGNPFYTTHLVHPPAHTQQQVQLVASVSGGLTSAQKQHALQQVVRNCPPCSPQQQQIQLPLARISQLPSHLQQQHTHDATSHQIQQLAEREGNSGGDSNSTLESKFPNMQRIAYGQGNPSVVNPPSALALGVGVQSPPLQDFNLTAATVGAKQAKQQLQPSQVVSQQQSPILQQGQVASQLHASGPALHMNVKGIDQQSSQTFSAKSIAVMNRGCIGPGPLGLASVAAVMAPQGHAMLQNLADPVRGQSHQHSLQSGQQQLQHRGAVQMQRATVSAEDSRTVDGKTFASRNEREVAEDRKMPSKQGIYSTTNLSLVDLGNSTTAQGGSTSSGLRHPRMSSGVPTLNLMTPAPVLSSRPSGLQQPGATLPGNQNSKLLLSRSKLLAALGDEPSVPSSPSQLSSFSDRPLPGPSLPSKVQGPPLSLSGQNVPQSTQLPRQGQASPHPQLKLSNRGSLGSLPTPSGTAPQAVLAAAIAKSQQGSQQQQSRPQAQGGTNTGPSPRLPSGSCGSPLVSTSTTLPLPPVSKSAPTNVAKCNLSSKNSFPHPHKPASGVSGKRSAPVIVSHVSSILGPSPLVQNLPSKSFQDQLHSELPSQQTQQNINQHLTQPSKLLQQNPSQPSQSSISTQYRQQQAHLSSQQIHPVHNKHQVMHQQQTHQMQRQVFLQNSSFQQLQQSSGSLLNPHSVQQSSHQVYQQPMSPSSQPQQHSSSPHLLQQQQQQQQQQLHHQQQHNLQGNPGSFSPTGAKSLSLGPPNLTLGTGSIGNNPTRPTGTRSLAPSQSLGLRSTSVANNITSGPGTSLPNSRIHGSGPSFLQAQICSSHQQSISPKNSSGPQYLQILVNSEASGKLIEHKAMSDGSGQEQGDGLQGLTCSSPSRLPQIPHPGSPGLQPMSSRQATGGTSIGKSSSVQFVVNNYSEDIGSRSGLILSVAPPSLSSGNNSQCPKMHSNKGNSAGITSCMHLGVDGRPSFGGSSAIISQGPLTSPGHGGSAHQSSHSVAPSTTTSNNSQSVGQTSTVTSVGPP